MRTVWLNGALVREDEAWISPFDRGLLLGDAVFETLRTYGGRAFALDEHLERLERSCKTARLAMPRALDDAVRAVLEANGLRDAAVRLTVTRGPGGRGASPHGAGPPTVLVTASEVPPPPGPVRLVTATRRRVGPEALEPTMKTTNYLAHVLARAEAEEAGADDALFVDAHDDVVEATQANVFAVFGQRLLTPSLASGCLPGVTRAHVLSLAREAGLDAQERPLPRADLHRADEVFLTASVSEVVPVVAFDGARIGTGAPGPRALALHRLYRKRAEAG